VDIEDPACARHDLERADLVLPLLEQRSRETRGVRARPSGDAVLDADVVPGHGSILPARRLGQPQSDEDVEPGAPENSLRKYTIGAASG
jgi:hypothetical protein